MVKLQQISYYNDLYDLYNKLLTEKQGKYFVMYYQKDYSLKEIADYYHVSRNAVYDLIKVTKVKLEQFEKALNLYKNKNERKYYFDQYQQTNDEKWLEKIMQIDDTYGI